MPVAHPSMATTRSMPVRQQQHRIGRHRALRACAALMAPCKHEPAHQAGLLSLAGLHSPDDLRGMAHAATLQCQELGATAHQRGPEFLNRLVAAEERIHEVQRPAKYVADFHADPGWRSAARDALEVVDQAWQQLQGQEHVQQALQDTAHMLMAEHQLGVTAMAQSEAACSSASGGCEHTESASMQDRAAWQRIAARMASAWRRTAGAGQGVHAAMRVLRVAERQCAAGLRLLMLSPQAAPRLVLSPPQAQLLAPLLPGDALCPVNQLPGDGLSPGSGGSNAGDGVELQPWEDWGISSTTAQEERPGALNSTSEQPPDLRVAALQRVGLQPRRLRLHGNVYVSLAQLDGATDAACEAACGTHTPGLEEEAAGLVVLWLTQPVIHVLLAQVGNEAVRKQVYESAVLPLAAAMCAVVDELRSLRNRIAQLQGHSCHTAAVLEGSVLAGPTAASQFLSSLGRALGPMAAHQAAQLAATARRAGLPVSQPAPAGWPGRAHMAALSQLEPWDRDYVRRLHLEGAQQRGAEAGRRTARRVAALTGWSQYAEYFTMASVLKGIPRLVSRVFGLDLELQPLTPTDHSWGTPAPLRFTLLHGVEARGVPQAVSVLGTLFVHLHGSRDEFPFTTLLSAARGAPVVLLRLPLPRPSTAPDGSLLDHTETAEHHSSRADLQSDSSSPWNDLQHHLSGAVVGDPLYLSVLLHELGHALQFLLSSQVEVAESGMTIRHRHDAEERGSEAAWGPLPQSLGCAVNWPLEWRETAASVFERWAREPSSLQLISCHRRLGTPIPAHDAARAAALATAAALPGGNLEVWSTVRAALAEQLMYSAEGTSRPLPTAQAHVASMDMLSGSGVPQWTAASAHGEAAPRLHSGAGGLHDTTLRPGPEPGYGWLPDLPALHHLEQQAVLGGAQWVYVLAKLVASATWRRWLEEDPLSPASGCALRHLLLGCPAFASTLPQAICKLLADDEAFSARDGTAAYAPDLAAACWQDIDLAA